MKGSNRYIGVEGDDDYNRGVTSTKSEGQEGMKA